VEKFNIGKTEFRSPCREGKRRRRKGSRKWPRIGAKGAKKRRMDYVFAVRSFKVIQLKEDCDRGMIDRGIMARH
jgi:hypothetical protein